MRWTAVRSSSMFVLAVALAGCDALTGSNDPKIGLSASGSDASVQQSGSAQITITVNRSHFTKPVHLVVQGAPSGVLAQLTPSTVDNDTPSSTLAITVGSSVDPGNSTLTVRATGDGVEEQTVTIALMVTVRGTFGLTLLKPNLTVAQGGGGTATVLIARPGGNGSNVTLAATGAPAGINAAFTTSPTSTTSASFVITADAGVAAGTYPIMITGSAAGLADQATTLSLAVITPPATATLALAFCASDLPVWFAYRNEGFGWQQVNASGNTFSFQATDRLSVAFAFAASGETQLSVLDATRSELAATTDRDCSGSKTLDGSVSGLTVGQSARVVMGGRAATVSSFGSTFSLTNVAARPLDIVATRGTVTGTNFLAPDRMIIRRSVDLPSGSTIPALDFTAGEAFAPEASTLTINGLLAADSVELTNTFWTVTSTFGTAHSAALTGGGSVTLYSAPTAQLVAGDLHELFLDAFQLGTSQVTGRSYVEYSAASADRSVTMGPGVPTPSITTVTTAPYARTRAQFASQPEYGTSVQAGFIQDDNSTSRTVLVSVTAGFLGSTPASWDVVIPDITGVVGFSTSWMLRPNQSTVYFIQAFSGRTDLLFGALPATGDVVRFAYRVALTSTSQLYWFRDLHRTSRRLPQYLRR